MAAVGGPLTVLRIELAFLKLCNVWDRETGAFYTTAVHQDPREVARVLLESIGTTPEAEGLTND